MHLVIVKIGLDVKLVRYKVRVTVRLIEWQFHFYSFFDYSLFQIFFYFSYLLWCFIAFISFFFNFVQIMIFQALSNIFLGMFCCNLFLFFNACNSYSLLLFMFSKDDLYLLFLFFCCMFWIYYFLSFFIVFLFICVFVLFSSSSYECQLIKLSFIIFILLSYLIMIGYSIRLVVDEILCYG